MVQCSTACIILPCRRKDLIHCNHIYDDVVYKSCVLESILFVCLTHIYYIYVRTRPIQEERKEGVMLSEAC